MITTPRYVAQPAVFVLETGNRAILAFEATSLREARELAKEQWLLDDLKRLRSDGAPLWDGISAIRIGAAVGDHVAPVRAELRGKQTVAELAIVYLVPLDSD